MMFKSRRAPTVGPLKAVVAALAVFAVLPSSVNAAAVINHSFDRAPVHDLYMGAYRSSGESLADLVPPSPRVGPAETAQGDIEVKVTWADGTSAIGIWGYPSGSNKPNEGKLFPNTLVPGVHFNFEQADTGGVVRRYSAFVEQSGDTYHPDPLVEPNDGTPDPFPWEIRNGGPSDADIIQVMFSARGTPDMGFDTDDGSNPGNGAAGFLLYANNVLSDFGTRAGDTVNVHYDWFNNWNDTTDMFHRMTLDFVGDNQRALRNGDSFVFYQDTDEIPEPASLALVVLALGAMRLVHKRRA